MIVFRIGQGVTATADDATAFSHRYDPGNPFRLNQNIKPSRIAGAAART